MIEWILYVLVMAVVVLVSIVVRQAYRLTVIEAKHMVLQEAVESAVRVAIQSVAELREQVNRELNHLRRELEDESSNST